MACTTIIPMTHAASCSHPAFSIPRALLCFGLFVAVTGTPSAWAVAAGFYFGYCFTTITAPRTSSVSSQHVGYASAISEAVLIVCIWFLFACGPATQQRLMLAIAAAVTTFVAFGKVRPRHRADLETMPKVSFVRTKTKTSPRRTTFVEKTKLNSYG